MKEPSQPLPAAGGTYIRHADGSLEEIVPDGVSGAPEAPAEETPSDAVEKTGMPPAVAKPAPRKSMKER